MESGSARAVMSQREHVERLAAMFSRTADVLERSAGLAGEHAERCARLRRLDDAVQERQAAKRAQDAAQRARIQAVGWLELLRELDERERHADERDRVAGQRDRLADEPDQIADERQRIADVREYQLSQARAPRPGDIQRRRREMLRGPAK